MSFSRLLKKEETFEEEFTENLESKVSTAKKRKPPEKPTMPTKKAPSKIECSADGPPINDTFNVLQDTVQTNSKKRDVCDIFSEYIAEELRKHDDRTRMILQHKIHNLLFQAAVNKQEFLAQWETQS